MHTAQCLSNAQNVIHWLKIQTHSSVKGQPGHKTLIIASTHTISNQDHYFEIWSVGAHQDWAFCLIYIWDWMTPLNSDNIHHFFYATVIQPHSAHGPSGLDLSRFVCGICLRSVCSTFEAWEQKVCVLQWKFCRGEDLWLTNAQTNCCGFTQTE